METENLGVSENLLVPENLEKKRKLTYVMQGEPKERALDIYHLIFAPTHACNLRCKHCYLPDHDKDLVPKNVALRLVDEWSDIVLEERGQYGGIFHIKGGEPFVVPYLWDVMNRLAELQSLRFMMTTNGTFTTEDIYQRLSDYADRLDGNVTVIVSLDGATEETHAILRGEGQFAKTLKFLEGLRQYDITFYLNCVLHAGNIHELWTYVELAREYGASQVNFLSFVPRGIGGSFAQFQVPHLDVYRQLDALYKNADDETKRLIAGSLPHIKDRESGRHQTSHECVAAYRGMLYITPDGNVYTCPNIVMSEFSVGNVFRKKLDEISRNLGTLYQRLQEHTGPYICAGEKILYKRSADQINQQSLYKLQRELVNLRENKSNDSAEGSSRSYCFSKNW